MTTTSPRRRKHFSKQEIEEALDEYGRLVWAASKRGDSLLFLTRKTHQIIHSFSTRP